ncbi:MAG: hypothetical protein IJ569_06950 [Prevotella sp.]|nr:hypothetical protein [Prevotella sp.]
MTIVQRNFFRLIRCGAFDMKEQLEPMSVCKWNKLYQLTLMHDMTEPVYQGLMQCKNQFFLYLTDDQWSQWQKAAEEQRQVERKDDDDNFLRADHLTNPMLNMKLQSILDDEQSDVATRQQLLLIISIARHILNEGVPVRQLVRLGTYLRQEGHHVDFITLQKWLKGLNLSQIAQLEGALLIQMLAFGEEEIPFLQGKLDKRAEQVAQELTEFTNTRAQDFYFSQESGSVFVHTSNGSAMLGHIRRSARYFRYLPSETLTNFFASFAHSLSHIEE